MWSHQVSSTTEESNSIKCDREAEREIGMRKKKNRERRKGRKKREKRIENHDKYH